MQNDYENKGGGKSNFAIVTGAKSKKTISLFVIARTIIIV